MNHGTLVCTFLNTFSTHHYFTFQTLTLIHLVPLNTGVSVVSRGLAASSFMPSCNHHDTVCARQQCIPTCSAMSGSFRSVLLIPKWLMPAHRRVLVWSRVSFSSTHAAYFVSLTQSRETENIMLEAYLKNNVSNVCRVQGSWAAP
jgi:hypothetical protein